MSYPVKSLIEGQRLVTVHDTDTVRDALIKMVSNDYSQLPVVNANGQLQGIISEQTIVRRYHMSEGESLFALTVDHCMTKAVTLVPEDEVFDALGRLRDVPAAIIVENKRPVGVITYFDTTHFFRGVSEGQMYVEDVEQRLREIIRRVYPDEAQLTAALSSVFGTKKQNPTEPGKHFEELSFYDHLRLISSDENWPSFEQFLAPKSIFLQFMGKVRQIRNQLAHFRDDLDMLQQRFLIDAREWLLSRPLPPSPQGEEETDEVAVIDYPGPESVAAIGELQGKYTPITGWLVGRPRSETSVEYTFTEIEKRLGGPLPESARRYSAWWGNNPAGHVQARSWLQAGWLVDDVNLTGETVRFRRNRQALYILFHDDVMERLVKRQPTLVSSRAPRYYHWLWLPTEVPGTNLGWSFIKGEFVGIGLHITTGSGERNKEIFDSLYQQKAAVEEKLGLELKWERDADKGVAAIRHIVPGRIDSPKDRLDELKDMAADLTIKFADVFMPLVRGMEA